MYYRLNLQPDPMKDYYLQDIYGNTYIGRWLVGNTYEGWYIKEVIDPQNYLAKEAGKIYSQKEIKIYSYKLDDEESDKRTYKNYIPKRVLDEAFFGHKEIGDFRETPEILSYI